MDEFFDLLSQAGRFFQTHDRPFVVASYVQSINGSIAGQQNMPMLLSGQEALVVTHRMRAACDGILIGIETVLADDPQLTVRYVDGRNRQPIVLDSRLRMPLKARLLQRADRPVWLFCRSDADSERAAALRSHGAIIVPGEMDADGTLRLANMLAILAAREIRCLLVKGGAKALSAFFAAQYIDLVCITIAPVLLNGKQVFESSAASSHRVEMKDVHYHQAGRDLILWGIPHHQEA